MFEVINMVLKETEIKRMKQLPPATIDVKVSVDKAIQAAPDSVILEYSYIVDYAPGVALVRLSGEAYCKDTPENIKKAMADYAKTKKISVEYAGRALNAINASAGINALTMIRPFNLMPHFMPPLLVKEKK